MKVVLIEDNEHHAQQVQECLQTTFQDAAVSLLRTEHEVMENIEKIAGGRTDVIILDIILPWCRIGPNMPPLPECYEIGGPYRAGIRCLKTFLAHPAIRDIPIIVHSVVDTGQLSDIPDDLPPTVLFLGKPLEPERMAETIESFLLSLQPKRRKASAQEALLDAADLRIGLKDLKIDLKKLMKRKDNKNIERDK